MVIRSHDCSSFQVNRVHSLNGLLEILSKTYQDVLPPAHVSVCEGGGGTCACVRACVRGIFLSFVRGFNPTGK